MTQAQQKIISSLLLSLVFGLSFSYRGWQLCCTDFSGWNLFNPPSLIAFFESAILGFIVFFTIIGLRCNWLLKLLYTCYVLAVLFLESPFRFYTTSLVMLVATLHAIYFFVVEKSRELEVKIFTFLTALTFTCFPWVTPFRFNTADATEFRLLNSILPLVQPIYKGFISAKFLNFSSIDYAYYASAISIPIGNSSFLLQVLGYIFDVPSISTASFFFLLNVVGLLLFSAGSFFTFLLFKEYLKASTTMSVAAALILFLLNKFTIDVYTNDNWMFISAYSLIPLAIIGGIRVLRGEKNSILTCALILAAPFALIAPHPNYYIAMLAIFGIIMVFLCAEWETDFKEFCKKLSHIGAAFLVSFLFSAHYLLPIIKQHLAWDCHTIPHDYYHCYHHCNKEIFMALFACAVTGFLSVKYKKVKIGFYFSVALLVFTFLLKKTTLLDFALGKIFGGAIARLPLFLWFISGFMALYYGRNLKHKTITLALITVSILDLSYLAYKYSYFTQKQSYHIFLEAESANLPALKKDKSSSDYIRNKIAKYEQDFPNDATYKAALESFGVKSIKLATPDQIITISQRVAGIIDNSYAPTIHNIDDKKLYFAISPYNTSRIYNGLEPFHRIESAIGDNFHTASGPGLLLNNNSTGFEPRNMTGYIPTEFFYIMKNYDYIMYKGDQSRGLPMSHTYAWSNFDPTHPKTQHMMNIIGVDYITSNKELNNLENLRAVELSGAQYNLYHNPASYGLSYIANIRDNSQKQDLKIIKEVVKDYFKDQSTYKNYEEVMAKYERRIFTLKSKYDAIVEDNDDLKDNSGRGKSKITNIVGNMVITDSTCRDKDCILALNFSHFPQWKAFSQNFSQLKIYDVNFAFMGVRLEPSTQKVLFIYLSYLNEAAIILSLIMVAAWILCARQKNNLPERKKAQQQF